MKAPSSELISTPVEFYVDFTRRISRWGSEVPTNDTRGLVHLSGPNIDASLQEFGDPLPSTNFGEDCTGNGISDRGRMPRAGVLVGVSHEAPTLDARPFYKLGSEFRREPSIVHRAP